jgi:hypothetical protein
MGIIFTKALRSDEPLPSAAVPMQEVAVFRGWRRCNGTSKVCMITKGDVKTSVPLLYVDELLEEYPFFAMKISEGVYDARQHHYADVVNMAKKLHLVKTGQSINQGCLFSDLFKSGGLHLFNDAVPQHPVPEANIEEAHSYERKKCERKPYQHWLLFNAM